MFRPVPKDFDVPAIENTVIEFWRDHEIQSRYLHKNDGSDTRFSFLDGPITANGQMGVHHAWGRSYKDVWQRYHTMLGDRQRYQNGFDCQGLWVEVTVERELGFTSKRDIERYGIADFVRKCKASVFHFADIITSQSQRLGQFMDWDNSYYTLSDENNYTIWHFLKRCHERGLIYKGTDVMPWCTRCGTGLSEHEIATEGYQDVTHTSVFVQLPLLDAPGEYLLVWTTTPWTLSSNVAVAVNPNLEYVRVRQGENIYYIAQGAVSALRGEYEVLGSLPGSSLVGRHYHGPFDSLEAQQGAQHVVIPWEDVAADEGTGLVHIAPGCGKEDFQLGRQFGLKSIAPIDQDGVYVWGFDWLTGRNVHDVAPDIIEHLRTSGVLYRPQQYTHRYPTCWRCGTELVFRLVDEWFISMEPLREPMMDVVRSIRWIPTYGLDRELDWLRNMDDWMISKKRYWGLALPFWICPNGHTTVVGGKAELQDLAISGLEQLESPHRPWIDEVTIACPDCGEAATRIKDVGNPWLDAGIVPYATLGYDVDRAYFDEWFPADFITESFPGQFRNWFYSLLAMSTVLEDTRPFNNVLGYQLVRGQDGREMHKSWGNAIAFDEAADRAGADLMRWLFLSHNPTTNVNFGWESLDAVKRRLLVAWNTYSFFVTYANLDGWTPASPALPVAERPLLDRWVLARLHRLVQDVRAGLDDFNAQEPCRAIERFIDELSTWYVRLGRRRFWRAENDDDKASAYATLYECLSVLTALLAPFMPFVSESLYQNLKSDDTASPDSIHLCDFPQADVSLIDEDLLVGMSLAQEVVALGRAARDKVNLKVRQPLARVYVTAPSESGQRNLGRLTSLILDELNIKDLQFAGAQDEFLSYSIRPNLPVLGPRFGKRLPVLRAALDKLDPATVARSTSAGEPVVVNLDGEPVTLTPADILVDAHEREGYAAMAQNGVLVALDTELTEDLIREGYAREIIRRLNDWRKSAGYQIEDRIDVRYQASPALADAMRQFASQIQTEALAVSLSEADPLEEDAVFEAQIGEQHLKVGLERVPAARALGMS